MGKPEAAQSEQTEIVLLRQQLAELEARCQAVTAERDEHSRQIDLHYAAGERESIAALLADRPEATTYLKVEALEKAESTLRATLEALVECDECRPCKHDRRKLEQVLGAAPREGQS